MTKLPARFNSICISLTLMGGSAACMNELEEPISGFSVDEKGETTKELPWGASDDPSVFSDDLKYNLEELPLQGAPEQAPWTASYWPTYKDSINAKWDGANSMPASTKYGQAFGVQGVEDAVSQMRGIAGQRHRKECTANDECKEEVGEACAKRDGEEKGRCTPTWFGICHAWAPAAILTPEPKFPVVENGVEFKVNDIKALVTLAHDSVVNKFVSLRCNTDDGEGDGKIEYDEYGRPKEGQCIDTNPATLHLLVTNYLGIQRQSFVMDRTFDDEVWNQPLRSYQITKQVEVSSGEANALIGATVTGGTTISHEAELAQGAWDHFDPLQVTAGENVKVRMEGTGDGDLYVRFDGQPTSAEYDCRPYSGGSAEECELDVPANASQVFVSVYGYSPANVEVHSTTGGNRPVDYLFNDGAEKFFHVKMDLQYISESDMTEDGNLGDQIDRFTHTDHIEYILELDGAGRLIGGEYVGSSKRAHPDFLWLPIRNRYSSVASGKIKYSKVMDLLNRSLVDPEAVEEENAGGPQQVEESGDVSKGEFKHFGPFTTAEGTQFLASMTGTGDADLYVRRGAVPTLHHFDCRPYKSSSNESCALQGLGDIYVAVHGYQNNNSFSLEIEFTAPGGAASDGNDEDDEGESGDDAESAHLSEEGAVTQGEFDYYQVNVVAGQIIVVRTQAANDIDVYLQMGQQPTTASYVALAYTVSGNETIRYTASTSGVLHIGVYGYAASSYTMTTADQ